MKTVNSRLPFFTFLLWLKTYVIHRFIFDLQVETSVQEMLVIVSPISSILFIIVLTLFFREPFWMWKFFLVYLAITIYLYFNVLYYRFFNDFITIPVLFQTSNITDLGASIIELIKPLDVLLFIDLPLFLIFSKGSEPMKQQPLMRLNQTKVIVIATSFFILNIGIAHIDRPELLTRSFDRKILVKNIGIYNYHLYDLLLQTNSTVKRAFADSHDIAQIEEYMRSKQSEANPLFNGLAKNKNIVLISLESTQSFVVNETLNGQELTPFLNELIRAEGSYYFSNFYHQTGQGKTSDAEFLIDNSLYGVSRGAVFFTNAQNEYKALPEILKNEADYYSAVFHANNKSFWNRDVMYETLGYDRFFSEKDYSVTEENSIGWGLKDDAFFEQSIDYLKSLPKPYYVKFITLTNHFPYSLKQKDELIPEWTSNDGTVNRYFTTIRFQDEALKTFFELLKDEGLYEDSIFIIYGDHYGISENHNQAMSQFLQKEITPFEQVQLQRVPLIVHLPSQNDTKTISTVSGQIDLKPTILNLAGVNIKRDIQFGTDLFSTNKEELIILRDGSFITKQFIYTKNKCYQKDGGVEIETEKCESYINQAKKELQLSDKIIYGDLLRFLPTYVERRF